jgi:UDP-glucuronate 4-epimerase
MTILVTGAAGFIGSYVSKALLSRGEEILGIDSLNTYYDPKLKQARLHELERNPAFKFVFADLGRFPAVMAATDSARERITAIVHLAAQAGVRHSIDHPLDYLNANLGGHLHILELARQLPKLQHLVYASSSSVYGASQRVPFGLDDPCDRPVSLYAATKRSDELMSEAYAGLYGIPLTGLRFFTVYGPAGRPDMAYFKFTANILAGKPIEVMGDGTQRRDFTYIDDIVAGVLAALDRPPGRERLHRIFNLGNDRPERLSRLLELVEQACGKKAEIKTLPVAAGDVPSTWADISVSRSELGYDPKTPLEVGIPKFVEWYRGYSAG